MQTYTAGEAIGPAWAHTRALLFDRPLRGNRWTRLLKISLVALGAQLTFTFNSSFQRSPGNPGAAAAVVVVLGLVLALVSLLVGIGLLYLGSRLQLTLFDIVLLRDSSVAPAWTRHAHHAWRWAGIKLIGMVGIGLLLSPLLVPALGGMFALMAAVVKVTGTPQHPVGFHMPAFRALLVVFAQLFAVLLLFAVLYRLFLTLTLPVLALQNLSVGGVLRQAGSFLAAEPAAMAIYAVLQFAVQLALGIGVFLCWLFAVLVPAGVLGLAGWGLWTLLHGSTAAAFVLGTVGVVAASVFVAWALATYIVMLGTAVVFIEAYALYFIGGRYPPVGQYLETVSMAGQTLGFRD